ncbi:TPA: hypothetical protein HA318_03100 [Candidatus Micrarchaeota archaeon]|nr:hypothetical protein [Candidatus Micrarchaeota archaeon]
MNGEYMFGSTADAFRLAKRHFNDIKRKLPRDIAFHEIPFDAVLRTTVRVLSSHPAFSVDEGSRAVLRLRLQEDGLHPYERYEIGHRFFLERVVSHLKAELKGKGGLSSTSNENLRTVLGKLFYASPSKQFKESSSAVDALSSELGVTRASRLIFRAFELWREHAQQYKAAKDKPESEGAMEQLVDMFVNPSVHYSGMIQYPGAPARRLEGIEKTT